jgi:hypothetical protein
MRAITGPGAGHSSLAQLAQGTVCKILAAHDVKPHKVCYHLERRDPQFEPKMAEVLCVYREVAMPQPAGGAGEVAIAVVFYDEKPGIQAIGTTAPDLPPVPSAHPTIARDHEYKQHGTVTLMIGIDLLTGQVRALVRDRHRSREFIDGIINRRCRLIHSTGNLDYRVAVEVVDEFDDALLELVLEGDADVKEYGAGSFGKEALDKVEPRSLLGG